jgi:hypothetical protein
VLIKFTKLWLALIEFTSVVSSNEYHFLYYGVLGVKCNFMAKIK